ncbi:MAG TPA: holo-ACP synthase [Syntrophorhabdaceae bacterium]|jgi:holo-[acyl-carrier protein] synthase
MVGVDIVEVSRIAAAVERYGEHFLRKIFTEEEVAYARRKKNIYQSLAGRFAAKEAFMKARGRGLPWREIAVHETGGRPFIMFQGQKYEGISISHEKAYAVSVVIL